ncbi:MAG: Holliday junction branch migration protein RuvA [Candidatus Omnitrophica bacterium]|nr:Holliday junction branch migration protein RuvA [Candidatus Omnitrophota bacterium]
MIARICGKVIEKGSNHLLVEVGGIVYQVLIPSAVMQHLDENIDDKGQIKLITYHYLQSEPAKSTPILVGFLNEIEKEFFEVFITVSGIGPKAALKALSQPISLIAQAIDEANTVFLKSLPGIGEQRAKEIVAKLQNKIGKFGLIQDKELKRPKPQGADIEEEALAVLMQLEYKRSEAMSMIKKAMERSPKLENTEDLLNEVYKQKRSR